MLLKDIKNQIFSVGMLLSVSLGLVLLIEPQVGYFSLYFSGSLLNKTDYMSFLFSALALGGYLIFTPIITVLPDAFRFCEEYNSGYLRLMLVRSDDRKKYIANRLISNAICSGVATCAPLTAFALIMLLVCKPFVPDGHSSSPFYDTIFEPYESIGGGLLVVGMIILLAFLFGVVWGVIGTALSAAIPNRYVALCGPFVLFYLLHLLTGALDMPEFSPTNTILPDILPSFSFLFVYQGVLLALGTAAFVVFVKRRLSE